MMKILRMNLLRQNIMDERHINFVTIGKRFKLIEALC